MSTEPLDRAALAEALVGLLGRAVDAYSPAMLEVRRRHAELVAGSLLQAGWSCRRAGPDRLELDRPQGVGEVRLRRRGAAPDVEVCLDTALGRRASWLYDVSFNVSLAAARARGDGWASAVRAVTPHAWPKEASGVPG